MRGIVLILFALFSLQMAASDDGKVDIPEIEIELEDASSEGNYVELSVPLSVSTTRLSATLNSIHQKLITRHPEKKAKGQNNLPLWAQTISDENLERLLSQLTDEEQRDLRNFFGRFDKILDIENDLIRWHELQIFYYQAIISYTAVAAVIAVGVIFVLGWFEFFQFKCVHEACDDPAMLMTKTRGIANNSYYPIHYCAHEGPPTDCLLYKRDVLGLEDLARHRDYEAGCSENLDETLIGTPIELGTYHKVFNRTCQVAVGFLPVYPLPLLLLPFLPLFERVTNCEINIRACKEAYKNLLGNEQVTLATTLNRRLLCCVEEENPQALFLHQMCGSVSDHFNVAPTFIYDGPDIFADDRIHQKVRPILSKTYYREFLSMFFEYITQNVYGE